jgi:hypothetical protein
MSIRATIPVKGGGQATDGKTPRSHLPTAYAAEFTWRSILYRVRQTHVNNKAVTSALRLKPGLHVRIR